MARGLPPQPQTNRNTVMRAAAAALLAVAAVWLAGCEQEEEKPPQPPQPEQAILSPAGFEDLPGWATDRHAEALPALLRSCARFLKLPPGKALGARIPGASIADIQPACRAAQSLPAGHDLAARAFFEQWFEPWTVTDNDEAEGLFTGYFEIELQGSLTREGAYNVPVYRRPQDHVTVDLGDFDPKLSGRKVVGRVDGGRLKPYFMRGDIQNGVLAGKGAELLWLKDPLDAFMLHVQGSGRVTLPDGRTARIGFAAHNGFPYKSIGRELIRRGELEPHAASWPGIRAWLMANPTAAAELLAVNRRYIFFNEISGDGPIGAQGVALTPGRSMAVDTRYIPLGLPLWLDTTMPDGDESPLRRLMLAQDTGAAIKGPVRGDFFWGTGDDALVYAGRMKSRGRYFLLLPKLLANRLASG